ncbi:protein jagged-2-like [Saccoglossus kowalevskii]
MSVHINPYLDDWLIQNPDKGLLARHVRLTQDLLHQLGLSSKSQKVPSRPDSTVGVSGHGVRHRMIGVSVPSPFHCVYDGQIYSHNQSWQQGCNSCQCNNGISQCSQVWCGPGECEADSKGDRINAVKCQRDQKCEITQVSGEDCFTSPCGPVGVCLNYGLYTEAPSMISDCLPNEATLDNTCAMITLLFDKKKMPLGVSVSYICSLIQHTTMQQVDNSVVILCDNSVDAQDSIVVAVSTPDKSSYNIRLIVDSIANHISKQNNSSVLAAIQEVKIETTIINYGGSDASHLIPLLCSILGSIGLVLTVAVFFYYCGRRKRRLRERYARNKQLQNKCNIDVIESKNNQREQFRKLKNPIFEHRRDNASRSNESTLELEEIHHLNKNVPRTQKDIYKPKNTETKQNMLKNQQKTLNDNSRTVTFELMV